ncbi:MAG: helix-turn-helix domain-containing protein [Actinomycetota bacterium]|nr:helix-turn-helix domain-containing protein [Actinomycetota bacterium]
MTTGEDLRQARLTYRWGKDDVARYFDIDKRTLTRWERSLPAKAVPAVEDFIKRLKAGEPIGPTLRQATDAQLLAEVANRLERARMRPPTLRPRRSPLHADQAPGAYPIAGPDEVGLNGWSHDTKGEEPTGVNPPQWSTPTCGPSGCAPVCRSTSTTGSSPEPTWHSLTQT